MAQRLGRCGFAVLFVALIVVAASAPSGAGRAEGKERPRRVLIIRHAEKPPPGDDSVHLSPEGKKRAEALPRLFEVSTERPTPLPPPGFIFAARNSKQSHRPTETVAALATKLRLPVNATHRNEDFPGLVREIFRSPKYAGKTVLICWHHGTAPELARRLGAVNAPHSWKGAVFDRVWEISYDDGKATFRDRPQRLLTGDAER